MNKKRDYVLFLKYIITYVITLGVFFALIIPVYLKTHEVIKRNSVNESYRKLLSGVNALDIIVSKMYDISKLVEQDSHFLRMSRVIDDIDLDEYFYLGKTQELMRRISASFDVPAKSYVLFEKNNLFISNIITLGDYKTIFSNNLKYERIPPDKLKSTLFGADVPISFLPAQNVTYLDGKRYNALTYVIKMGMRNYTEFDSVIVFTLDTSYILNNVLSAPIAKDSFLYIKDSAGNVIYDNNYDEAPLDIEDGVFTDLNIRGTKYSVMSSSSIYGQLNITIGIPERVFHTETDNVISIIRLYILLAIIIALIFSGLFALRRLWGDRQILDTLSTYEREAEITQSWLKKSMLEHLLMQGIYSDKEKSKFAALFDINIEYFVVIVTDLKQLGCNEQSDSTLSSQLINVEIQKQLESYMQTRILDYNASVSETVFLVCLPPEYSSTTSELIDFMLTLSGTVHDKHGVDLFVGVSSIGVNIDNVHICYLQAKNALRQIIYPYSPQVNKYTKNDGEYNALLDYSISQQLHDLIITGEAEAVTSLFNKITKRIDITSFETDQDIMQLFFSLRNPIFNAYVEVLKENNHNAIPHYKSSYTIFEILQLFNKIALDICFVAKQKKKSSNMYLKQSVLEYLNENYSDINICAAYVADKFSISEKYVYSFVKEHTGKTFGEYLENIRMEKAKYYLLNTNNSINKIAEQIGFSSINTFYKAFNRMYGMAPGKYRETYNTP